MLSCVNRPPIWTGDRLAAVLAITHLDELALGLWTCHDHMSARTEDSMRKLQRSVWSISPPPPAGWKTIDDPQHEGWGSDYWLNYRIVSLLIATKPPSQAVVSSQADPGTALGGRLGGVSLSSRSSTTGRAPALLRCQPTPPGASIGPLARLVSFHLKSPFPFATAPNNLSRPALFGELGLLSPP